MQIDTPQAAAMLQDGFTMDEGRESYKLIDGHLRWATRPLSTSSMWHVGDLLPWSGAWTVELDEQDMSAKEAQWLIENEPGACVQDKGNSWYYRMEGDTLREFFPGVSDDWPRGTSGPRLEDGFRYRRVPDPSQSCSQDAQKSVEWCITPAESEVPAHLRAQFEVCPVRRSAAGLWEANLVALNKWDALPRWVPFRCRGDYDGRILYRMPDGYLTWCPWSVKRGQYWYEVANPELTEDTTRAATPAYVLIPKEQGGATPK